MARPVEKGTRLLAFKISGRPISELQEKTPPPYNIHMVGLHRDREDLYDRIDRRVERMLANGLVQEVSGLREQGYRAQLPAMSGLGYRQILAYLRGEQLTKLRGVAGELFPLPEEIAGPTDVAAA